MLITLLWLFIWFPNTPIVTSLVVSLDGGDIRGEPRRGTTTGFLQRKGVVVGLLWRRGVLNSEGRSVAATRRGVFRG